MRISGTKGHGIVSLLVGGLVAYSLYVIFLVVPNEAHMGAVQRIFYYHVASAFSCYLGFFIVLITGLAYLASRNEKSALIMDSAGEVGFVFCTICLGSGMIWGQVAWNTPFQLEPRLVATLILWMIFLSFNILRIFGDPREASHQRVFRFFAVPFAIWALALSMNQAARPAGESFKP